MSVSHPVLVIVIDKDGFVQTDNIIQLNNKRRQKNKLSSEKISKVLRGYNELIDVDKKVFITKKVIIYLNEDLKYKKTSQIDEVVR